jgi:hypothetical protein
MDSFLLLVASYFVGSYILAFFGISLPVVQVGGGLILVVTGWTLLKQRDDEKHDVHKTVPPNDGFRRAFYPLTLPLTVGPGSISVAVTLGANAAHSHDVLLSLCPSLPKRSADDDERKNKQQQACRFLLHDVLMLSWNMSDRIRQLLCAVRVGQVSLLGRSLRVIPAFVLPS